MHDVPILAATVGGMMIGLSAVLLLWLNGRIAGVSGIWFSMFDPSTEDRAWRVMFIAGLVLGALVHQWISPQPLPFRTDFPLVPLLLGGFLVGYGTRLGSGCTSGHGVCGIGRLSPRSLLATGVFMAAGITATSLIRSLG